MTTTPTPRWSLGHGNAVVPYRWQATPPTLGMARASFTLTWIHRLTFSDHFGAL
jgi:hypothetical protein